MSPALIVSVPVGAVIWSDTPDGFGATGGAAAGTAVGAVLVVGAVTVCDALLVALTGAGVLLEVVELQAAVTSRNVAKAPKTNNGTRACFMIVPFEGRAQQAAVGAERLGAVDNHEGFKLGCIDPSPAS